MDPEKILGVSNNASKEEIQRAYRQQAKKHHPDRGGDSWAFQQVQEAYEALINPNADPNSKAAPAPMPKQRPTNSNPQFGKQRNQVPNKKSPRRTSARSSRHDPHQERHWWELFVGELPLQIETMLFILINCLDIFLTHKLLRLGAVEANPIANYFFGLWNFNGMIVFKLSIVATVCIISQVIALKRMKTAQGLLLAGIIMVGAVVIYSIRLYYLHFYI